MYSVKCKVQFEVRTRKCTVYGLQYTVNTCKCMLIAGGGTVTSKVFNWVQVDFLANIQDFAMHF